MQHEIIKHTSNQYNRQMVHLPLNWHLYTRRHTHPHHKTCVWVDSSPRAIIEKSNFANIFFFLLRSKVRVFLSGLFYMFKNSSEISSSKNFSGKNCKITAHLWILNKKKINNSHLYSEKKTRKSDRKCLMVNLRNMISYKQKLLSPVQLKRLSEHKYTYTSVSLLDPILQPWWCFLVSKVPIWLAPNLITIIGLVINIVTTLILILWV